MPLPPSAVPSYQPASYVSGEGVSAQGLELFFRYHPAVAKTKTLELLIRDETLGDAERRKILSDEINQINGLLARYRSTGAGPSGTTKTSAGGSSGGGLSGDSLDFLSDMSANEIKRAEIAARSGADALRAYDKLVEIPRAYAQFSAEFIGGLDRARTIGSMSPAQLAGDLELAFLESQQRFGTSAVSEDMLTRQVAATDLYYQLRSRRPDLLPAAGDGKPITREAADVIGAIDRMYGTDGFIINAFQSGREPVVALDAEKRIAAEVLTGKTKPGASVFESAARKLIDNLPANATTEQRAAAMTQARAQLGMAEPLDEAESAMLARYVEALSDDGVATEQELGADLPAAKAAYEKGRRAENLPRGTESFYDPTYLDLLKRRASLQSQASQQQVTESPIQRAARRAEGLPEVTREAYDAAAAVSPLAAESLPYALRRYTKAGGVVTPESGVERKAERILRADPNRRPSFLDFVAEINKLYPNDDAARREAFAYYGAYFHGLDSRTQTADSQAVAGTPPDAAPAARAPQRDLAGDVDPMALLSAGAPASLRAPAPAADSAPAMQAALDGQRRLAMGNALDQQRGLAMDAAIQQQLDFFLQNRMNPQEQPPTPLQAGVAMSTAARVGAASLGNQAIPNIGPEEQLNFGGGLLPATGEEQLNFGGGVMPATEDDLMQRLMQQRAALDAMRQLRGAR